MAKKGGRRSADRVQPEVSFETAMDEYFKGLSGPMLAIHLANMKRTYDTYQGIDLDHARNALKLESRISNNAVTHDQQVNALSLQALQSAVTTQDMIAKQAVRHGDVAIDGHWGVRESDVWLTIMASKVAEKLNNAAAKKA
jgi:hypothetical protein